MAELSTIITGIKTRIAAKLPTYTQINHQVDLQNNSEGEFSYGYAVVPSSISLAQGLLGYSTVDQTFIIKLVAAYNPNQIDDTDKVNKTVQLLEDDIFTLYNDLVSTRAGATAYVINIGHQMTTDVEYITDNSLVVATMNLSIIYRKAL